MLNNIDRMLAANLKSNADKGRDMGERAMAEVRALLELWVDRLEYQNGFDEGALLFNEIFEIKGRMKIINEQKVEPPSRICVVEIGSLPNSVGPGAVSNKIYDMTQDAFIKNGGAERLDGAQLIALERCKWALERANRARGC